MPQHFMPAKINALKILYLKNILTLFGMGVQTTPPPPPPAPQMPSFLKNVRRRQLLLNLYLFLCNLAIALALLQIWSDKTKLSKRFDSKKYAKKVKQMC